jgi:hypothetical protein
MSNTELKTYLTLVQLAKIVVGSPNWRWMPGMLAGVGFRVQHVGGDNQPVYGVGEKSHKWATNLGYWVPDLTDPATMGCLTQLVREAWGDCTANASYNHRRLRWEVAALPNTGRLFHGDTEAEALVSALVEAPWLN